MERQEFRRIILNLTHLTLFISDNYESSAHCKVILKYITRYYIHFNWSVALGEIITVLNAMKCTQVSIFRAALWHPQKEQYCDDVWQSHTIALQMWWPFQFLTIFQKSTFFGFWSLITAVKAFLKHSWTKISPKPKLYKGFEVLKGLNYQKLFCMVLQD